MKFKLIILFFTILFLFCPSLTLGFYAPANYYPVPGEVQVGSIITVSNGKYSLSSTPNDQFMLGTVTDNPAMTEKYSGPIPYYPVVSTGEGYVLVSAVNGPIRKGDYITSSFIPGVGQKGEGTGNTIGIAEDDFAPAVKDTIGKIPLIINIHYISSGISQPENSNVLSAQSPTTPSNRDTIYKSALAVFIVTITLILAFKLISKMINKEIESAKHPHKTSGTHKKYLLALHLFLVLVILYVGFITGSLILK